MATTTATNTFLQRLIGAASLDAAIYEEVESDRSATGQALMVIVLSSLAAGVGARGLGGATVPNAVFFAVVALMAWGAWALLTLQIGSRILPESRPAWTWANYCAPRASPRPPASCGCSGFCLA
jgi:ABC-type transport system involved in cytochrome c biogenesis permease subunit